MAKNPQYKILSLDGGGIRGIVTAVWLSELEKRLGKPLNKSFDLIAGTSTGSILAAAISSEIPASSIVELYRENGQSIFPKAPARLWDRLGRTFTDGVSAPKYSADGLEKTLKKVFKSKTFGQLKNPTLIFAYNVLSRDVTAFKSFRDTYKDLFVWQVVRASCSAPTYFPAMDLKIGNATFPHIDGGVAANNPSACAVAEAISINLSREKSQRVDLENFVVASFGTGANTRPISSKEAKEWGPSEWVVPLIDVILDGSTDTAEYVTRQILGSKRYFRFQIALHEAYDDLDRADAVNVNALVASAEHYLRGEGGKILDNLVDSIG